MLSQFRDASIYQTWDYGAVRWGADNVSHFVLYDGTRPAAMCQLRLTRLPFHLGGVAYAPWGPVLRREDSAAVVGAAEVFRALRDEYASNRGMLLRCIPNAIDLENDALRTSIEDEGFTWTPSSRRTYLVDLEPSLDELRAGLHAKWRSDLNRSERNDLEVVTSVSEESYAAFLALYQEMHDRKGFDENVDVHEFGRIQATLPDSEKLRIVLARSAGETVSATIIAAVGESPIYLLGATNPQGRDLRAAYRVHWHIVSELKDMGRRYYDLGGFNPEANPGVYRFKARLAKTHGADVRQLGQFDASGRWTSGAALRVVEWLRKRR